MNGLSDLSGRRVFITGGAGFIGSRLARALTDRGAVVSIYDNLLEQVHGAEPDVDVAGRLIIGDIRDEQALAGAISVSRPEIAIHLAAETGTGQSADEPARYADVNVVGCAKLIEILKAQPDPPRRVILAATRAVYGEGAYRDRNGRVFAPEPRSPESMADGVFDLLEASGEVLEPLRTREDLPPRPGSVYGSTKLMQEYLLQQTPAPWDVVLLRLQNVFGPGQSLRNPYTGVLSIFCQQILSGGDVGVYEDGRIFRDFVYVDDVVAAFVAACTSDRASGQVINIGTGHATSILHAAERILAHLGAEPNRCRVNGAFRAGDVRHAVADVSKAADLLDWRAEVAFDEGVARLVAWARSPVK